MKRIELFVPVCPSHISSPTSSTYVSVSTPLTSSSPYGILALDRGEVITVAKDHDEDRLWRAFLAACKAVWAEFALAFLQAWLRPAPRGT